ncbi:MAG TPA: glucosaminidase domain-containing protein [Solirubrobacteraceae bacterium]|nr:glucosaminidase domain-containing protein [Solirubrobacteraceae bacterium]
MASPQLDFIRRAAPGAQRGFKEFGVPASVTIAQAILESGWGKSHIGSANNYFGIKAQSPTSFGPIAIGTVTVPTREVINGRSITVNGRFRKYRSMDDSMRDHGRFLRDNPRYKPAFAVSHDANAFAQAIHRAGYATDPKYSGLLISLMKQWNLYQFDRGGPKANGKHRPDKRKPAKRVAKAKPAATATKAPTKPAPTLTPAQARARAFVANLQRDLNDHLLDLGSPRRLAIDGKWDPHTQAAFEQVCRILGVEPERSVRTFRLVAATAAKNVERDKDELHRARTKGAAYAERLKKHFENTRGVGIAKVGGRPVPAAKRAQAAIITLQRDLNAHLRRLGSPRVLAVDGTWNPYTDEAFKQVCRTLGIAPQRTARTFRLIAGAAAVPRADAELDPAARTFRKDLEREFANARQVRQAVVVGGTPMSEQERAAAYIAGLQRDLNTQLKWLGSTRRLKVDGTWDDQTQRAFNRICRVLGIEPVRNARTFRVVAAATVTRTQAELRRAKEDGQAFKADLQSFFALEPSVLITQHKPAQPGGVKPTGGDGQKAAGKTRIFRVKSPEMKGNDIRAFQRVINERYKRWGVDTRIEVDGEYGTFTRRAARQIAFGLGLAEKDYKHGFTPAVREKLRDPGTRTQAELARAERRGEWRRRLKKRHRGGGPAMALAFARAHIGVKEIAGNNRGKLIDQWNQASGSPLGSAWCGNFMNACLRAAGFENQPWLAACRVIESHSRAGTGGWQWLTSNPRPGDLILFTINGAANHVGMVESVSSTQVVTIEGNTRADSEPVNSNPDAVERRHRPRSSARGYARPPYDRDSRSKT